MKRDVFGAIADPTRRQILHLLSRQRLNLNAVAAHFDISRPAISKHMKILEESGLVAISREGRERYCEPRFQRLKEVVRWTEQYRHFWNRKLDDLGSYLEKDGKKKR